jgi:hypothetical protein
MPKFWVFLTRQWLGLPDHLSWSWWRALGKSPWSACAELRTSMGFSAQPPKKVYFGNAHRITI